MKRKFESRDKFESYTHICPCVRNTSWSSSIFFCIQLCLTKGNTFTDSIMDQEFLTAPVNSAVDKFQLIPEFLKVTNSFVSILVCVMTISEIIMIPMNE